MIKNAHCIFQEGTLETNVSNTAQQNINALILLQNKLPSPLNFLPLRLQLSQYRSDFSGSKSGRGLFIT